MAEIPSVPRPDEAETVFNPAPPRLRPDEAATLPGRAGSRGPRLDEAETIAPSSEGGGTIVAKRYRIVRCLGQGGMGSVWLARDLKLDGREVALKMLPSILAGKRSAFRLVKDEALMAMKLSHPNIATVRAFEEDESGNPFLVMDYVEGEALDEMLAARGPLSAAETLRRLGPVAAALDYAHGQGVVHRDVKPGNVMVRRDGTPFVLDFGVAREIRETMTRVTGKTSGGTLLYMSPEQLNGRSPKAAQDVYSFAAMAYECLAGKPPFARGQIEWQILHNAPEKLPDNVPQALREGVMAGLAKEPERRPPTCAGVLAVVGAAREKAPSAPAGASPAAKNGAAGEETVFLRKVRLAKTLEEASKANGDALERAQLEKLRELLAAADEALKAGDKPAASKLMDTADEALAAWREAKRTEKERLRQEKLAAEERKRREAEERAQAEKEAIVARQQAWLEHLRQAKERQLVLSQKRDEIARKWEEEEKASPLSGTDSGPLTDPAKGKGDPLGWVLVLGGWLILIVLATLLFVAK